MTYDDVIIPLGRLCDKLRVEQDLYFDGRDVSASAEAGMMKVDA
jgi:hypothetical protein